MLVVGIRSALKRLGVDVGMNGAAREKVLSIFFGVFIKKLFVFEASPWVSDRESSFSGGLVGNDGVIPLFPLRPFVTRDGLGPPFDRDHAVKSDDGLPQFL